MRIFTTTILCLLFSLPLFPQGNISIERIGVEQGLSQGFVTGLMQDREGFVWASTLNGLNRFDGRRFRFFKNDPFDSLSLPNNWISAICDTSDFLLLGTDGGGLNIFHKKTERVFRVPFETTRPEGHADIFSAGEMGKIPGSYIVTMFLDKKGSLWMVVGEFGTPFCWVCRLDFPENFWEKLPENPNLASHLVCKRWFSSRLDAGSKDWGYPSYVYHDRQTDGVIFNFANRPLLFNQSRQTWEDFPKPIELSDQILHIVFSKNSSTGSPTAGAGSFWHNKNLEVWYFDGAQRWEKINYPGGFVLAFDKDYVWARDQNSIEIFETAENPGKTDFSKPRWKFPVQDNRHIFLTDQSANFWWAEGTEGILKFSPRSNQFQHFLPKKYISMPLHETPGGLVFLETSPAGLVFLDKNSGKTKIIGRSQDFKNLENCVAVPDNSGFVWTLGGKSMDGSLILDKTDMRTGITQKFDLPFFLFKKSSFKIDENGLLWFMTDGHFVRFDTRTARWTSFDCPNLGMEKQRAIAMSKTPDGSWWMATEKGLLHAKPSADTFQFEVFRNNPADRNSPNSDNIASLLTDPTNPFLLWMGTRGGGLNSFQVKNKQFRHFSTHEGMPDDVIYGIQPDAKGNLWMSSNRGIIRFNPAKNEIKSYLKVDGAQDFEFNTYASGVCRNGDLMFGGVNGLNIFNPEEMNDNPVKPSVRLTNLKLNNLPVAILATDGILKTDIGFVENITVPFSKNNVTLEFAALEFTAPSKNRFRFFLEGAEREWAHKTGENFASYLNLQPGEYVFKILGSNNDGVFGDVPTVLKITVLPPWYRSFWAYLGYALVLGGWFFWYWRMRENRLRLELELEKQQRGAQETAFAREKEHREAERAAREFEVSRREAEQVRESDRQQLEMFTQNLMEKNQLIAALQKRSHPETDAEVQPSPADVEALYDAQILTRKDWESFKVRFERVHPGLQQTLAERFSELSESDLRLILLLKMGLKNAETATILGISPDSVKKARQRLRKKLQTQDVLLENLINDA